MRMVKSLVALGIIAGLFGVVGLYSQREDLGEVSSFYSELMNQSDGLFYFYQIILFILLASLFLVFWFIIFKPKPQKKIHIVRDIGEISLPITTLESIATSALEGNVAVTDAQARIHLTKKQKANVTITVAAQGLLVSQGHQIQQLVEQALQTVVQIETKRVVVVFKKKKLVNGHPVSEKKQPRVI